MQVRFLLLVLMTWLPAALVRGVEPARELQITVDGMARTTLIYAPVAGSTTGFAQPQITVIRLQREQMLRNAASVVLAE